MSEPILPFSQRPYPKTPKIMGIYGYFSMKNPACLPAGGFAIANFAIYTLVPG